MKSPDYLLLCTAINLRRAWLESGQVADDYVVDFPQLPDVSLPQQKKIRLVQSVLLVFVVLFVIIATPLI